MKIVIPGGTGEIGTLLARAFLTNGHDVAVLSRNPISAPWRVVRWDAKTVSDWAAEIDGADVVINLAGRNVNCRYNARNRRLIKESRVESTRAVGEAIARAARPPRVWLQASTATIYAHRYDAANDEATGILGGAEEGAPDTWRFSIDVAKSWEQAANERDLPHTRTVLFRSAMIMSPDLRGVFDVLLRLVRWRLGGASGDGRQYVSWIHDRDFVRAIYWLIDHSDLAGPVNLAAPNPLPNAEFMRTLRRAWGIGFGLPATHRMLEIGAFFLRTETELILKSRRVVPARLLQSGFVFLFPTWAKAADDLCRRWREWHRRSSTQPPTGITLFKSV
ncbi:MAG TPA: TIGR01777 family oxidoreductase [Gemmataceae bacterium]|nr:TIGR01777 family oxidoreductase [Gemmataceae bacterium]